MCPCSFADRNSPSPYKINKSIVHVAIVVLHPQMLVADNAGRIGILAKLTLPIGAPIRFDKGDAQVESLTFPAFTRFRARFLAGGATHPRGDCYHSRDDGANVSD